MIDTTEDVIGTRKAAEILGVSVRTVQLWVENGTLKAWKTPGNHRRILRSSIDDVINERTSSVSTEPPAASDILVVEDEKTMQAYYQALFDLIDDAAPVRFASNGFEGLVEYGRQAPRLMLVDVDMPGMNGIEMISSLRLRDDNHTMIAVVTGLDEKQLAARGGIPDGIPVFSKPIGLDDLKSLVAPEQPAAVE